MTKFAQLLIIAALASAPVAVALPFYVGAEPSVSVTVPAEGTE
jgi:hypothetical protein